MYKHLLSDLYEGVCFVDQDGNVTYWNEGAERITGYKASEVMGKRYTGKQFMHMNERSSTEEYPLMEALINGRLRETELYLHHKHGYRVPVLAHVAPIRDAE